MDQEIGDDRKEEMAQEIQRDEVKKALTEAPTGKAAGLDGIPAELWKKLNEMYERDVKEERPSFDVIRYLTGIYNDIE